ncbi:MAG: DUF3237 domain-containing protein [Deltaproteobacteria bacterium]|nr:DUF3237 domain-containing protein [Deltaproteobacteria bacterium]
MTPRLEFVFKIHLTLGDRMKIDSIPGGNGRGFVPVTGGEIEGPKLTGKVIPFSGGDWPSIRPDGVTAFDSRYMLETSDGALIYINNRGYRHAPPDILEKMEALEPVDPSSYYFRVTPVFEAPTGPHDWLTRNVFVGVGDRRKGYTDFSYYEVL